MKALIWKRVLGRLWGRDRASKRDVILTYHSIAGGALSIPKVSFREQMKWLSENASVVTLDELLSSKNLGGLRVVLSFDDGYSTLLDTAAPILADYSFPAIVYLNSRLLGEDKRRPSNSIMGHYPEEHFLTWAEVARLIGSGWTAGGHGLDHIDLTKCSLEEAKRQLVGCKAQIEANLGVQCEHFAYTWGHYSPNVRELVIALGFRTAVAGIHGPVTQKSDLHALPRVDIRADYKLRDFIDVVNGRWDFLRLKQQLARKLL